MQRMPLVLIAVLLCAAPGCLDLPKVTNGGAGRCGAAGERLPQAYGYYGTGHPLDRPNQIRREVVYGQLSAGKPCWKL